MNLEEINLSNPGILCSKMPTDIFQELKQSCQFQIDNKDIAYNLKRTMAYDFSVQGIKESITANIPLSYRKYLENFAKDYYEYYNLSNNDFEPRILSTWLNLQKRYEYRPLHLHPHQGLSFVTYISIPYDIQDEDNYENHSKKATVNRNGRIEFFYNSFTGTQQQKVINIDKSFEGKTIMFLGSLVHVVYPFYTSEEFRISLAGNISQI